MPHLRNQRKSQLTCLFFLLEVLLILSNLHEPILLLKMSLQFNFFHFFWKAVGILEDKCNLQVVAISSGGASSNRTMYRMHAKMERVDFSKSLDDCVIYKTSNIICR